MNSGYTVNIVLIGLIALGAIALICACVLNAYGKDGANFIGLTGTAIGALASFLVKVENKP